MPRFLARPLTPTLALVALLFLSPALATALPLGEATLSAAERQEAGLGLFSEIWHLLSALWADTGSGLDPDDTNVPSGSGTEPAASTTDTGSILDPNG